MPAGSATVDLSGAGGCVCVDGHLMAPDRARVSALDAGLLLGDGLFESLRAVDGVPYLLERHLERLLAAARELQFSGVPSAAELSARVLRALACSRLPDAYVRVTLTRGTGSQALAPPDGAATVVIAALPAPPRSTEALRAALLGPPPEPAPRAKSTSRQQAVVARMGVERRGAHEGLYVSAAGHVLEGTSSNVFACVDGRLLTPPSGECLPGITRGRVLELARGAGVPVLEGPLPVDVLLGAEAAFVTNAVHGLRPIAAVDGRTLAEHGREGPYSMLLGLYGADRESYRVKAAAGAIPMRESPPVATSSLASPMPRT